MIIKVTTQIYNSRNAPILERLGSTDQLPTDDGRSKKQ